MGEEAQLLQEKGVEELALVGTRPPGLRCGCQARGARGDPERAAGAQQGAAPSALGLTCPWGREEMAPW